MINNYPLKYKKFSKILFQSGDASSGARVKLDPTDFNDLQDIWLTRMDNFIKAIRGLEGGVLDGCNVTVQAKQMTNAASGYEAVVSPGNVYANSTVVTLSQAHAVEIPTPTWAGFKTHYFVLYPRLQKFVPTAIGDPGFSLIAGRPTANRVEVTFELAIIDALPTNTDDWYILLAALKIDSVINGTEDIIIDLANRNNMMTMRAIQDIATQTQTNLSNHIQTFFNKQDLVGNTSGTNRIFYTKFPMSPNSEEHLRIYKINGTALMDPEEYIVTTIQDGVTKRTKIEFVEPPTAGDIIRASYYPEPHLQHLSFFTFEKHIKAETGDHDNRYYTEEETDTWRNEHDTSKESHATHVLWDDFDAWKGQHTGGETRDHDNVYSRLEHIHPVDKIIDLREQLTKIEEEIGYGSDDYYVVTQKITSGIDGTNKIFPLSSSLLDAGIGYIKQVRADITHDAVKNPVILNVIDASQEFDVPLASAFSEPKRLSLQHLNANPVTVRQSDGEVWIFWASKENDLSSKIWFSSYKPGDGFFSPATNTSLSCNAYVRDAAAPRDDLYFQATSRISATIITSPTPTINQRIMLVWEYNNKIFYSYIDEGQTEWRQAFEIPGTENCYDPTIAWIDNNSEHGVLYLLYRKLDPATGLSAIYRKRYEINLAEYDVELKVSDKAAEHVAPQVIQEKSPLKRIWYTWLVKGENVNDPENSWDLNYKIVDRFGNTVYQPEALLGNISGLNLLSGISVAPKASGMWVQYSKPEGGLFNVYYQTFNYNGSILEEPVFLVKGTKSSVVYGTDDSVWVAYEYIDSIYYRARQRNIGEVKWNQGLKRLEFEVAPVTYPILVDIAVPLRSLNDRVSAIESKESDTEEELATKIRDNIVAMGLTNPTEKLAKLRNKLKVEATTEIDTRRRTLGYDVVLYNKFFDYNAIGQTPLGLMSEVLKGSAPTLFGNSGMYHDDSGMIWNKTGQIIKVYTIIQSPTGFLTNGRIRLEANGDLVGVDFRITSTMDASPFSSNIRWIPGSGKITVAQDLNLSGEADFVTNNRFALEITLRPNGFLYDWALFMKG